MKCEDAVAILRTVHSLRKTAVANQRPDANFVREAVCHFGFRHYIAGKNCRGCEACHGCDICRTHFPEEICADNLAWRLSNLGNDKTVMHYALHRITRIPQCIQNERILSGLHKAYLAALDAERIRRRLEILEIQDEKS